MRPRMIDGEEESVEDFYAALLLGFHDRWGKALINAPHALSALPPHCWLPRDLGGLERLRTHMQFEQAALERGHAAISAAREEMTQMVEHACGQDRLHWDLETIPISLTDSLGTPGTLARMH